VGRKEVAQAIYVAMVINMSRLLLLRWKYRIYSLTVTMYYENCINTHATVVEMRKFAERPAFPAHRVCPLHVMRLAVGLS